MLSSRSDSIDVQWTGPAKRNVLVRGYVLRYGAASKAASELERVDISALDRQYTIGGLGEKYKMLQLNWIACEFYSHLSREK